MSGVILPFLPPHMPPWRASEGFTLYVLSLTGGYVYHHRCQVKVQSADGSLTEAEVVCCKERQNVLQVKGLTVQFIT
jgi:hypothetical protein